MLLLFSSDQYLSVSFYRGSHSSKHKFKTMYFLCQALMKFLLFSMELYMMVLPVDILISKHHPTPLKL